MTLDRKIFVSAARGESYADVLRRTGAFGVLPGDSDVAALEKANAPAVDAADRAEAARDVAIAAGVQYASEADAVANVTDGAFASYLDDQGRPVWGQRVGGAMFALNVPWFDEERVAIPTVAQMLASTKPARGTGRLWRAGQFHYEEAPAVVTNHDEITAGGVKLYALPTGEGFQTNQFSGGIGARVNKAIAAVKRTRTLSTASTWWQDVNAILINPGNYALDETIQAFQVAGLLIRGFGVRIHNSDSDKTAFHGIASPMMRLEGVFFDYRNNNLAAQAIHLTGQCSWALFDNVRVQANSTDPNFACWRLQQGDINGLNNDNRDFGNFWVKLNDCWTRKLTGGDTGNTQICVDLQGCQNAFRAVGCSFNNFAKGIWVRNQNGSLSSGISNDVQVSQTAFEGFSGGVGMLWSSTDAGDVMAGGSALGCRFESGTTAFQSDLTGSPSTPFQIFGTTGISSVTNYVVDARGFIRDQFASLDCSVTPGWFEARHISNRGVFFGAIGSGYASVRALSRQLASGATFALERGDGTIDGRLSQRPGGGLDIDGGAPGRVRVNGMGGLSGTPGTHAANFRGNVSLGGGATSVAVTLPNEEPDASYGVYVDVPFNSVAWVTNKTTTGFTINIATPNGSPQTLRWLLWR